MNIKWKFPSLSSNLFPFLSLCVLCALLIFDQKVANEQRALGAIKEMIPVESFDFEEELLEKKWKIEKITEKKMGDFRKISYRIECEEPLLLEEIKALLHHPELFSNLITTKSYFCFYEKIFLDRSEFENPNESSFKTSWCCYIPANS